MACGGREARRARGRDDGIGGRPDTSFMGDEDVSGAFVVVVVEVAGIDVERNLMVADEACIAWRRLRRVVNLAGGLQAGSWL